MRSDAIKIGKERRQFNLFLPKKLGNVDFDRVDAVSRCLLRKEVNNNAFETSKYIFILQTCCVI